MANNSLINWLTLTLVPGLGSRSIWRLVQHFGGVDALFAACAPEKENRVGIRPQVFSALADPGPFRAQAVARLQALEKSRVVAVCPDDEAYPRLLQMITDPPSVLYLQGRMELLDTECVAMVGSRKATAYGKRSSHTLAKTLAQAGVTVVSGLAMGIDCEAHRGALSAGGATIAVLGCGLDVVYPRQNLDLYEQIRKEGLLVSEYFLGTRPDSFRFPARNRIIAGLSRAIVVVEAAKKSGSLITAEMGLEEGREIFAVPGQIDSFKSEGTHWLLQQGARLVASAEDILSEFTEPWQENDGDVTAPQLQLHLDVEASVLLRQIEVYPCSRNELIVKSGLDTAKVAELLLVLELEGAVEILPGDQVRRII